MAEEKTLIQLRWEDPDTGMIKEPVLQVPVAIGREAPQMPEQWGGAAVTKLELPHKQVSRFHALITTINQQFYITDKSANGTFLNGRLIQQDGQPFGSKDTLRIGPYKITVAIARDGMTNSTELNLDYNPVESNSSGIGKNAVLMWGVGILVLLLMAAGSWKLAQTFLEQSRPQIELESSVRSDLWHG
ncbi:MAG: FHA domain-containing protein [Leptolyngbyaceae bacterium]|nr:FHA domain-containing protein [Leptolyngbyaceae bacterium]